MRLILRGNTREILRVLVAAQHDVPFTLSIDEIGRRACCHRETVKRHLASLEALHLITRRRPCRGHLYSFQVLPEAHATLSREAGYGHPA